MNSLVAISGVGAYVGVMDPPRPAGRIKEVGA
jgi:hypothetical protein